jgi:hypothetical protein
VGLKHWTLHLALIAVLFTAQLWLSPYHATNLARIMVLAVFAMGYNLAFGYTGLLSLGHALLLAAGMYAAGFPRSSGAGAGPAFIAGIAGGGLMAAALGLLALRTAGVSFMIVTLMFAQAGYLTHCSTSPPSPAATTALPWPAASRTFAGLSTFPPTPPAFRRPCDLRHGPSAPAWPLSGPPSAAGWSRCGKTRSGAGCLATTPSR